MKHELNGCREYSPAEISEVISRYRSGGLALAAFARKEGIPSGRLHYWLYGKPDRRPGRSAGRPAARPAFQEVRLAPPLAGTLDWAAEVKLSAGVLVRFSARVAPEWIGSVVQALQRPC
jgi:hypothetical protein